MINHIFQRQESHIAPDVTFSCSAATKGHKLALSGRIGFILHNILLTVSRMSPSETRLIKYDKEVLFVTLFSLV